MMAGEFDVDAAVAHYQETLDTWADANGPAIENYKKWLAG